MAKMRVIRELQAEAIKNIAVEAAREALESEGLEIEPQGMIWSDGGMQLTLNITLPAVMKHATEQKKNEARKLCGRFGLPPDTFAREFYLDIKRQKQIRVKVVDIRPRNHKYPIVVEVYDHSSRYHGKRFKCTPHQVKKALGV